MNSELFQFKFNRPKQEIATPRVDISSQPTTMSDSTFKEFREFIYQQSGIYFTESKKYLLEGRIGKLLQTHKMSSFEEYVQFIKSPRGRLELPALYEAVTINETYFFRSEPQFEALEKVLIPEIIKARGSNTTIRIWSAASSTGEEAYTTAIIVNERLKPMFPGVRFQIQATDINNAVLESARRAKYKDYAIRNVQPHLLKKYFRKEADGWVLSDDIKRQVSFTNLNLFDSAAMRAMKNFDIIFCCNVLIYFDLKSKQQVVTSLYDALNNHGFLFIGYSESLHGVSKAFKLVHLPKAMVYKKE